MIKTYDENDKYVGYEIWLHLLVDLFFHSTEECQKELLFDEKCNIRGSEHLLLIMEMEEDLFIDCVKSSPLELKFCNYICETKNIELKDLKIKK